MNNNGISTSFDGSQDLDRAHRRKIQNRLAQRKHRERIKAQQRNPSCEIDIGDTTPGNSVHTAHQSELAFGTPGYTLQDLNILSSADEAQEDLQQIQSLESVFSPSQQSEDGQTLDDQFTKSFQAARDEINGQFLNNQDWFLRTNRDQENSPFVQTKQECESATATQAIALLQNQRARICDQAKWHLEKVLSLYDFGVSLDILEANPNLRNLLMDAYKTFNADRLVKTQDNEPAKSEETQWAIF